MQLRASAETNARRGKTLVVANTVRVEARREEQVQNGPGSGSVLTLPAPERRQECLHHCRKVNSAFLLVIH